MQLPTHVETYARMLLCYAVSLRPGQDLYIRGLAEHHDFGMQIGESCYEIEPRAVHYRFADPDEIAQLIRRGSPRQIALHQERDRAYYSELIRTGSPLITLSSQFEPDPKLQQAAEENPANYTRFIRGRQEIWAQLNRARALCLFPSSFVPSATTRWAKNLFPELPETEAIDQLWQLIAKAAGADQPDAFETFPAREAQQKMRVKALNDLGIREIHVTGGGNDLTLGFPPNPSWHGGCLTTSNGQPFYPNFPTEEIFTTPDRRTTEGRLVASKPLRLFNCAVVKNLVLEFRQGRLVDFSASEGREAFARWIEIDEGARYLGEIGLVAEDSRIGQTGAWFDFNNLDENAAAHVALGQSIDLQSESCEPLTDTELAGLGCNRSAIHTDILFGNPEVTIHAIGNDRRKATLIENGRWRCDVLEALTTPPSPFPPPPPPPLRAVPAPCGL